MMTEKSLRVDGRQVSYLTTGQGEPILILHGWGRGAESWQEVGDILARKNFQVIIPDLPGFGKSALPLGAWGVDDYMEWVLKFTQALGISSFFVLGHSFGGRIAIKLAAFYPENLKGLVLVAPAGISQKRPIRVKIASILAKLGKRVFSVPPFYIFETKAQRIIYKIAGATDYLKAGPLRKTFKKVISEDLRPYLKKIKAPALIIWGKDDKVTPLRDGYIIQKELPQAQLEVLKGLGHSLHLVKPLFLAKTIQNFVRLIVQSDKKV